MSSARKPFISVIIITKNHARTLPLAILATNDQLSKSGFDYEIIVGDAGSADASDVIAARLAGLLPKVRYFAVVKGEGEGAAARRALIRAHGHWRVFLPAENSVSVAEFYKALPHLLSGHDVALGSRALPRSIVRPQLQIHASLFRILHSVAVRLIATPGIKDTESGFLCMSEAASGKLCSELREDGAGWAIELVALARRHGFSVKEFPIFWSNERPFEYHKYKASLKSAFTTRSRAWKSGRHAAPRGPNNY
jgi:glycosyltransferase involved in cell wall biosynthesis